MKRFILPTIALLFLIVSHQASATHVRAGEIQAERISCSSRTYRITLIMYVDTEGVEPGLGTLDYGHGQQKEDLDLRGSEPDYREFLGDNIEKVIYYRTHPFPSSGYYTITFREENRNADIVNMDQSVGTAFSVQTQIVIDDVLGCDNSPILLNPPIDKACTGVAFFHNPGAIDLDGDSLSYEFTIPKKDAKNTVDNYRFPDVFDRNKYNAQNEQQNGSATFTINPVTGDIKWDAPGGQGEYNFAFKIISWKKINGKYYPYGFVIRDMQVRVAECDNERPELILPPDTCVVAGSLLEAEIMAVDPDNNDVKISSFGLVYEFTNNPAKLTPDPPVFQPSPATANFSWQTTCERISSSDYQVVFKAEDTLNGIKLATYGTWLIKVVGPPPQGLMAEQGAQNTVSLTWDQYECSNAKTIKIYRKVDEYAYMPGNCELGIPPNSGYELIAEVPANSTSFLDTDNELLYGVNYCYRLVATFNVPEYMESVVSEESCTLLTEEVDALITNVSIETTDVSNGEIFVRWTSPFGVDTGINPEPFYYELYRGTGFTAPGNLLISGGRITDTTFVDTGLNTEDQVYNYYVVTYDANFDAIDTSAVASSVRLEPTALKGAIELNWTANTPWTNFAQNFPNHLIYRDHVPNENPDQLVLIDSTNVFGNGFFYLDDGSATGESILDDKIEYCYYITTRGTYGNDKILEPFENNSQVICAQPNDSIPPCGPQEFIIVNSELNGNCDNIQNEPCNFDNFENELTWGFDFNDECGSDVRGFKVYFSESGRESDFTEIAYVRDTFFVHSDIASYKGCYYITAVDRSGNESEPTEVMCNDNCPYYFLPNVFTPNGDDFNDVFEAYYEYPYDEGNPYRFCPRFVESVRFEVFNRWGQKVYNSASDSGESSIYIQWDGIASNGRPVASGVYYYIAYVTFDMLDPNKREIEYKGWLKVERGN